jgi:hypothetical protein
MLTFPERSMHSDIVFGRWSRSDAAAAELTGMLISCPMISCSSGLPSSGASRAHCLVVVADLVVLCLCDNCKNSEVLKDTFSD